MDCELLTLAGQLIGNASFQLGCLKGATFYIVFWEFPAAFLTKPPGRLPFPPDQQYHTFVGSSTSTNSSI